jgi:hypothetical protein
VKEAVEVMSLGIGWVVVISRKGDGGLKRERTMSLKGICSVIG